MAATRVPRCHSKGDHLEQNIRDVIKITSVTKVFLELSKEVMVGVSMTIFEYIREGKAGIKVLVEASPSPGLHYFFHFPLPASIDNFFYFPGATAVREKNAVVELPAVSGRVLSQNCHQR